MIYLYLFIIGSILGSFYTVIGLRLPNNESIIKPRSHCDTCKHTLKWYELIPIVSYIFSGGRCRTCNAKISRIYPIIEILSGGLFVISYMAFGLSYNTLIMFVLSSLLVIIFVSDFKYYIILDSPLVIAIILILIIKCFAFGLEKTVIYLLSGIGMFITMYVIKLLGDKLFKKESLGGGDIKLSFVIGLTLGYRLSIFSLIIASFLALPYAFFLIASKKEAKEMPFGPFLISSLYLMFIFSDYFLNLINLFIL